MAAASASPTAWTSPQDDSSSFTVSIQYSWQNDRFGIEALAALAAKSFKALQFLHLLQAAEDISFVSVIGHLATRGAKDHDAKVILGQLICFISIAIDCHPHDVYGKSKREMTLSLCKFKESSARRVCRRTFY